MNCKIYGMATLILALVLIYWNVKNKKNPTTKKLSLEELEKQTGMIKVDMAKKLSKYGYVKKCREQLLYIANGIREECKNGNYEFYTDVEIIDPEIIRTYQDIGFKVEKIIEQDLVWYKFEWRD